MIRRHGAKFEAGGDKVLAAEQKKWVAADQGEVMSGCLAKRSILRNLQLWKCQFLKIFFSGGGKSVARQRAISVCLTSSVPTHFFLRATQDHLCQHIATWGGMALISRTLPSSMNFTNVKDLV